MGVLGGAATAPFADEKAGTVRPKAAELVAEKVGAGGPAPEPLCIKHTLYRKSSS